MPEASVDGLRTVVQLPREHEVRIGAEGPEDLGGAPSVAVLAAGGPGGAPGLDDAGGHAQPTPERAVAGGGADTSELHTHRASQQTHKREEKAGRPVSP